MILTQKKENLAAGLVGCVLLLVAPSLSHEGGYRQIQKKKFCFFLIILLILNFFLRNHKIYYKTFVVSSMCIR